MIAGVIRVGLILTIGVHAACGRSVRSDESQAGTVTLVNRVRAVLGGENCPACAASVEAALKQRLDTAVITVNPEQRIVDLAFQRSSPFASGSFRRAVQEAGSVVQKVDIEACGTIETSEGRSWITSGSARLLLEGPAPSITGVELCVSGELQDTGRPPKLVVSDF